MRRVTSTSSKRPDRSARPAFRCTECGWTAGKWVGRCGECQAWGSVVEDTGPGGGAPAHGRHRPDALARAADRPDRHRDRAGQAHRGRRAGPGARRRARARRGGAAGRRAGRRQVDPAARRRGARGPDRAQGPLRDRRGVRRAGAPAGRAGSTRSHPQLLLTAETDLGTVLGHIEHVDPDLLVLDSIQTIASAQVEGTAGGVSQVREVASAVIQAAKARDLPVVLIGHVTKDGSVAGPRTLEHLVDVVCQFEGERHSRLRMLRATKNRYGPTDEVGCFDLSETGIVGLADPSGLFISQALHAVPGTCLTVTLEGRRPLVVEVQSLVAPSAVPNPRRTTSGVDSSRLAMVLAVLQRRLGARLADQDVYVSTIGGARVMEPGADLALALAAVSSRENVPLPRGLVAIGEVGLAGEIRTVSGVGRRLAEAARLGFTRAIVPAGALDGATPPAGLTVLTAADLGEAVTAAGLVPDLASAAQSLTRPAAHLGDPLRGAAVAVAVLAPPRRPSQFRDTGPHSS